MLNNIKLQIFAFIGVSIGRLVRTIAESDPKANTDNHALKEAISKGEMISKKSIDKLIEQQLQLLSNKKGILIDGYPRDMAQVKDFEDKVSEKTLACDIDHPFSFICGKIIVPSKATHRSVGLFETSARPRTDGRYNFLVSSAIGTVQRVNITDVKNSGQ